eukprot:289226-Chlamydomonas_euryale.AAC.1
MPSARTGNKGHQQGQHATSKASKQGASARTASKGPQQRHQQGQLRPSVLQNTQSRHPAHTLAHTSISF